ncbi:PREDICTED: E3 ubiquitin-protein ligase XIAP isoform X1 [Pygoscelis adeliae]|uniref:E3 ubiquitin-protein ligase XIAP isoform X1 n=1 Tax=Pygoscelis adeliae TaxID=9238 RepID=UPI0004F4EF63|nr:PREDICTED: E3 ubiquitin-protein ligase XIAP isoform X1 [Pygoscelis adeliae]XP_009329039.1 PREDICTED: E3 ubiquitin-protein ligase XIAP isoform X1 [Pygoscelis adeliae]XP_009329047.1 PREDICTED: E3 ubiquitin-protein ligase XIAP isoform X1 [Pygoscelis adeliae]XP_009329055.1 PREDICTED: E3 ubiquitin-protein ligase XIAP isoform X1 [Pygoscelis adeliae]XP_009329064.1 PREDICTED: E3 ubiquitin-protein ligase XIAP isoform X1 [Pygoscelis adeliae]XP_009329074.1 PREDICTED: E3 ubiquitin-protein ligase XIAP i
MTCNGPDNSEACATPDTDRDQEWAQEHYRLGTFVAFPLGCPVSASVLAQAGFVYTGEGDKVKCFSCHTTTEGWAPGDSAVERHRKLSPNCKFITESTFLENNIHPLAQNYQHGTENGSSNSALPCTLDDPSDAEADYLVRTRQVVDMSDNFYPKNPAMCSEESRLKSFHNWPLNGQLTPKELANAGFYYTGVGDQVACFCCGGKLKKWEPSDRAWSEHKRHFPKCFFVLGRDVGNVPSESIRDELGRSGVNNAQHPRNPSMAKYGRRLQTFLTWIYPVDKEQLAEAGFYSIGNGDHVVCFHCGGGLQEWKENEDPWDQHAKWFPGCRFVRKEKGLEFINNVHLRDGYRDSTTEAAEGTILPKDDLLQNPLVQSAIDMGFSLSEIRNTMEKKLQMSGESHTSVGDLVADLSAQKENTREEEPNEIPVEQDDLIQLQNLYLSTEEKLRRLQEEKLCKICMAKDISVVLIPCGHLVACKECAEALNECPLCRTNIMKRQEIFMY